MRPRDKSQAAAGVLAGAGKPEEQLERECRAAILEAQAECGVGTRPLSAKLTQIVRQKGWPARYRPLFWSWAGTARRKAEEAEGRTYARLVAHRRPKDACSSLAEIERDLGRTLPGQRGPDGDEDYFAAGPGRDRLRNVLAAYAAFNPTVGYCQSMNFVAAVLLLQLRDEESAFWVLVALVEDVLVGYYHRSLAGLRVDQAVLEGAVAEQLPALAAHLRRLGLDLTFVSTNWLLCVFINALGWDCVLRLLDVLLQARSIRRAICPSRTRDAAAGVRALRRARGAQDGRNDVLLRAAVALLQLLQPKIMACATQEELLMALKPKDGPLTLHAGPGGRINADALMSTTFTKVRPLQAPPAPAPPAPSTASLLPSLPFTSPSPPSPPLSLSLSTALAVDLKDLEGRREAVAATQRARTRYSDHTSILASPLPVCGL